MSLETQINSVIEYLDAQSILVTNIELGKYGNGTAELIFNFSKKRLGIEQVKESLAQFGKKSVKMTECIFSDSPENANLGIATVKCTYDFTQQLNKEEIEKIAAAKGDDPNKTSLYRQMNISVKPGDNVVSLPAGNWSCEVRVDAQGNYYGTPFWLTGNDAAKRNAEGKAIKISKDRADSDNIERYGGDQDPVVSGKSC